MVTPTIRTDRNKLCKAFERIMRHVWSEDFCDTGRIDEAHNIETAMLRIIPEMKIQKSRLKNK